ncbi:hypothetical protein RFI_25494 [Reticulomyxa filosa]|uniref:Uncharacterized protein n=1 Tax=Reticulomyxa filosa TaxID=46433 RepID=X6MER7_RETFI|nr:hypothetical protein RFI_25494 [Reticulomyxa filosa]|eukprot:ETO11882.1 hypothetical protein RFI_25494 [Reticulomyxa filosa]
MCDIPNKQQICIDACRYALKKNGVAFMKFLQKNYKHIKWDESFEFNSYQDTLLAHLVCPLTANNVKCARYLLETGFMGLEVYQHVFDGALQTAISFQNTPGIKILLAEKFSNKKDKVIRDYVMKQMVKKKLKKQAELIEKDKSNQTVLNLIMKVLTKTMIEMVKQGKILSSDVFNLCWLHNKDEIGNAMLEKCKQLLNIEKLYNNMNNQKWLEEYVVNNRNLLLWMDEVKGSENENKEENIITDNKDQNKTSKKRVKWHDLQRKCNDEIKQAEEKLKDALEKEITSSEESLDNYKKLTEFKWDVQLAKECRQDNYPNGVQSIFNEQELLNMQINSDDATFNLKYVYDFEMYLNDLLARAHIMNDPFQAEMENIFRSCEGCKFEPGPIKTHNQCKLKAQVEYKDKKFPKSAHIIDVLRCQATFPNIERLVQGLENFTSLIRSPQYRKKMALRMHNKGKVITTMTKTKRTK